MPALCRVFLDESAPENVLEVTARAITYYLDVSAECTRRIVSVDGAVKMLCNRLVAVDLESRTSKDLAEQCVKVCLTMNLFFSGGQILPPPKFPMHWQSFLQHYCQYQILLCSANNVDEFDVQIAGKCIS